MKKIVKYIKNGFKIQNAKDVLEIMVGIAELVGVVLTLWSVLLVYDTLVEMRIDRQSNYRPNLCVIKQSYLIETITDQYIEAYYSDVDILNDIGYGKNRNIVLEIRNIGVGTAENVDIILLEEDCWRVFDEFNETTEYSKIKKEDRNSSIWHMDSVEFSDGTYWDFFQYDEDEYFAYILPNAEQKCEYVLPSAYSCMVNAIMIEKRELGYSEFEKIKIPDIPIVIEYSDIQGVKYREEAFIHTEIMWILGYGFCLTISISQ